MEDYRLTQTGQQVQDILDGAAMQSDLTAEKERAELAEQTLQGNIDAEALARQQQDGTLDGKIDANTARIVSIEGKIPSGASTENKLATELYVNSSVATNTATFRGTYNLVSDLHLSIDATNEQIAYMLAATIATADNNDYCFVQFPTSAETPTEIRKIARFKYNGEAWGFEYDLNNSGFTSDQWAAINSGITSGNVAKLAALPTSVELTALLNGKQNTLTFDTAPTPSSTNPVTSGGVHTAIDNEKGARQNADAALQQAIEAIMALIPSAANALNQLADKAFVNSSIATNTATFRGTFNLVSDLHLAIDATHDQIATVLAASIATADNNDYCYVQIPTSATTPTEIAKTERYKFNGTAWGFEYDLNNSGFTANQWAAINSGITAALVTKLGDLPTATEIANQFTAITNLIPEEATALNQLADKAYVLAQIIASIPAFKGQFETLAELQAVTSPKAGDLGIVRTKDSDGYDVFTFYQYLNSQWNVFYTLSHHPQTKPATTGTTGDYPYNGMGRVVIPKNMVNIAEQGEPDNIVNLLNQDAFEDGEGNPLTNTVFVIQYDFVLGEDIEVPSNCLLEFDGGSISAGSGENMDTITGNNTGINAGLVKIFDTSVILSGTWNVSEVYPEWWGVAGYNYGSNDYLPITRALEFGAGKKVVFSYGKQYYLANPVQVYSGTEIVINGTIIGAANAQWQDDGKCCFNLFDGISEHGGYSGIHDVHIHGNGTIDLKGRTTGWTPVRLGHCNNITIKDITISAFSYHAIEISGSKNVIIENVKFTDPAYFLSVDSNGMEIIQIEDVEEAGASYMLPYDGTVTKDVVIKNCQFGNGEDDIRKAIGTHTVLTAEQIASGDIFKNIKIVGNVFYGRKTRGIDVATIGFDYVDNLYVQDNLLIGGTTGAVLIGGNSKNINISNNVLKDTLRYAISSSGENVTIKYNTCLNCSTVTGPSATMPVLQISANKLHIIENNLIEIINQYAFWPCQIAGTITKHRTIFKDNILTNMSVLSDTDINTYLKPTLANFIYDDESVVLNNQDYVSYFVDKSLT